MAIIQELEAIRAQMKEAWRGIGEPAIELLGDRVLCDVQQAEPRLHMRMDDFIGLVQRVLAMAPQDNEVMRLRAENERLQEAAVTERHLKEKHWEQERIYFAEYERQKAENKRLRALLSEARQYVSDAGPDDDSEVQRNSNALLEQIDTTLLSAPF